MIVTTVPTASSTGTAKAKSNTVGIAVGVAVGAVAAAAISGIVVFYLRRRRNREIEEEHRRNAANEFLSSGKPGSSGGLSMSDARLDPVMAQRRMSDGSIADNEDYSRRILRVSHLTCFRYAE